MLKIPYDSYIDIRFAYYMSDFKQKPWNECSYISTSTYLNFKLLGWVDSSIDQGTQHNQEIRELHG